VKNPEAMSFDELLAFRERLGSMIARRAQGARHELNAQMAQLDALMSASRRKPGRPPGRPHALTGRKIAPKYRGPNGETWAGRGMMPLWLREQIKKGRKAESFAIAGKRKSAKRGRKKRS
jgi:DNA-binding protein H-NS